MLLTAYITSATSDNHTGNVVCLCCDKVMELNQFNNHDVKYSHHQHKDLNVQDDNEALAAVFECQTCFKHILSSHWYDHEKHDRFKYECEPGYKACDQCSFVGSKIQINAHYDEHFLNNSLSDKVSKKWNCNLDKWLGIEKTEHLTSAFIVDNDDVKTVKIRSNNQTQEVVMSRLYFYADPILNVRDFAMKMKSIRGTLCENKIANLTDNDQKCLVCNHLLESWMVVDGELQGSFAFIDVGTINQSFFGHTACILTNGVAAD